MGLLPVGLGLVAFIAGLRVASSGLRGMAGPRVRRSLRFASNRVLGVLVGAAVTAMVQSSTATVLALIVLVDAGALTPDAAFGVVMGANVGTCLTVQLAALRLETVAVAALAAGLAVAGLGAGARRLRPAALVVAGGGALALGMGLIRAAASAAPAAWVGWLSSAGQANPVVGALAAAGLTAVVQSSAAVTGAAAAMADSGAMAVGTALSVMLGANVGTCLTGILVSLGRSRAARLTAVLNLCFNLAGAVVALGLFRWFAGLVTILPGAPGRQVAHAHTLFNVVSVAVCLPCAGRIVDLVGGRRAGPTGYRVAQQYGSRRGRCRSRWTHGRRAS